ncbi:MAG: thioesterase family protein [Rhodospirillales bacterium]|nr:thioesterase family protein [Rhodospirillales bacterium]
MTDTQNAQSLPANSDNAAGALSYKGAVYPWHCDHVGHMNVTWYMGKYDEATWNFFAGLGLTPSFLRENGHGMAAVEMKITYQRELHAGDIVEVRTRLREIRDKVILFTHEMFNGETGELASRNEVVGVFMDTVKRRSCPFPETVIAKARELIAGGGA